MGAQLQRCYQDSLLKLYVVNTPRLFAVGWKLLQPLFDPVTWSKLEVLGSVADDAAARRKLLEVGVDDSFLEREAARAGPGGDRRGGG